MKIQQLVVVAVILLTTVVFAAESSWGWNTKDESLQSENSKIARRSASDEQKESEKIENERQGRYLVQEENIYSNDSSVEEVIDHILNSRREGRQLGEFDQVYADPNIQQALETGNEPMARNLIKDKLCMLGLMSCENTEEKRPFYSTIHAQGPPPPNRINGPYGHYGPPRPMPPPGKYGPPPGKYGPPRKVGYEGPQVSKPFYGGRPQGLGPVYNGPYVESPPSGSGSISYTKPPEGSIIYGSKPPGTVFEGVDAPYHFEHVVKEKIQVADSHHNNYYTKLPGQIEQGGLISGAVPSTGITGAGGAQVNVHHHFHHVEGADANIKAPIVSVPVSSGNGINSEFAALAASVTGGFSPSAGIAQSSAFNAGFNSAGQSSLISGNTGFGAGNTGFGNSVSNGFGSANNGFGSGNSGFGKPSGSFKPETGFGSFGPSSGSTFGNSGFGQSQSQSQSGLYQGSAGGGGYHTTNPDYYKKELQSGASQLNSFNGVNQYGGSSQYGGNKYVSGNGDYQYETSRQQHVDCTCVPIDQCPAADRIGRKEDLILPIDPRNLGKDIQAISDDSSNGTLSSKSEDSESQQSSEQNKKAKREVASGGADEKQLTDDQTEGRQGVNDFLNRPITTFGIGQRKVQPTFGVSFGLPYPAGAYPTNAFGQNPAQNQHFGAISPNGLNLGLLNVNPLVSFQVSKTEYGEKVLKPLVNLHVTPNENILNKVGNLFKAKKHPIINHHDHYHHHDHYNPELHFSPHHPHIDHHGPEFITSGPPPPSSFGHTGPTHFYHDSEHIHHESFGHSGPANIHHGPHNIYPSGPGHLDSYNPPTGPSYPFTGTGFDHSHYPGGGPFQRSYNLSNDQNLYANNRVKFDDNGVASNYAGSYNDYLINDRRGKQLHLTGESVRTIPTQVPGDANGGDHVSFPKDRRRRSVDDLEMIEKNNSNGNGKESVMSSSVKLIKRQAYYGPRPVQQQQCRNHEVCCRSPLRPPPQQQQQQLGRCGTRNANGITGRIKNPVYVDGDSEFGEYPWHVGILKKDPKESVYVCGGTLIDQQHIITAAHCIKNYKGFDLRVRLGEWDVNHDVEFFPYIERDVVSVHIHPEYYAGTLDNDLAVLKLDHPVDFTKNPHISPACLPDKFSDFTGARCWTTGWGKDAFGDYGKYQNILKEVDVPIIGHQQCQNQLRQTRLGYNYKLNPGFLCAGGEEGKDACKGDGGGPLVCDRNGAWNVVGVVSWGIGCGQTNVPGVYVRVAHYLDWINQITRSY